MDARINHSPELPGLARVVRGLSALFWSLPAVLLIDAKIATDPTWHSFGFLPSAAMSALMVYGIRQLRFFQSQERIWIASIERAEILSWLVLGLAPFPLWWSRNPEEIFLTRSLTILAFSGLFFVLALNHALFRLSLMIPDEVVRLETRLFSRINRTLLVVQIVVTVSYLGLTRERQILLQRREHLPTSLVEVLGTLETAKPWLLVLLVLVPVALTMTLIWKAKDVILTSVFQPWERGSTEGRTPLSS